MTRAGVKTKPYHVLVDRPEAWRERDDLVCHKLTRSGSGASFIQVSPDLFVVSPELMFMELAASGEFDLLDLVEIGYELCGTYVLDSSWDGYTTTDRPITSVRALARAAKAWSPRHGARLALDALRHIHDGSHSPMESDVAILLSYERRRGGLGLGPMVLNPRVDTPEGPRYVDILFPEAKVGVEYKGKRYHSVEQSARDDRRQNALVGMGYAIINVWYEDIVEDHLYEQLVQSIFRALGRRYRVRSDAFAARQRLLRMRLLSRFRRLQGDGADVFS